MSLFQVPSETRYDLRFRVFDIPVRVHPLFWLMALLWGGSGNLTQLVIWIVVIFFSILIHELGHSLVMRRYGVDSFIVLHMFGGLAVPVAPAYGGVSRGSLNAREQINISLAGPFAGFGLAILLVVMTSLTGGAVLPNFLFGFIPLPTLVPPFGGVLAVMVLGALMWVNVFWGVINLLPVYPLDGGQVARHLFLISDPYEGGKRAMWLSVYTGAAVAVLSLVFLRSTFMALLFGILAGQSYQVVAGGGFGRRY